MSVVGKWNVTMDTPIGKQKFVWDLMESGGGWQGKMQAATGTSDLRNIRVDGESVAFETRVNTPMGALDVTFDGAVNGDQISGACKTKFGDVGFSGSRG